VNSTCMTKAEWFSSLSPKDKAKALGLRR
jgi:hypothetical protein